jgi:hypothetical protein
MSGEIIGRTITPEKMWMTQWLKAFTLVALLPSGQVAVGQLSATNWEQIRPIDLPHVLDIERKQGLHNVIRINDGDQEVVRIHQYLDSAVVVDINENVIEHYEWVGDSSQRGNRSTYGPTASLEINTKSGYWRIELSNEASKHQAGVFGNVSTIRRVDNSVYDQFSFEQSGTSLSSYLYCNTSNDSTCFSVGFENNAAKSFTEYGQTRFEGFDDQFRFVPTIDISTDKESNVVYKRRKTLIQTDVILVELYLRGEFVAMLVLDHGKRLLKIQTD